MTSAFAADCLAARTVLITGACGALGQVVVRQLLAHGAHVVAVDLLDEPAGLPQSPQLAYVTADACDESAVAEAFDVAGRWGRAVDTTLVHAGVVEVAALVDTPLASFDRVMDTNVRGSFVVAREAARRAASATPEHLHKLVFTSSWVEDVPWPEIGPYNASKAAVRMLMRSFAREHARGNVRVNAVAPGIVDAGMARRQWDTDPAYRARASRAIPVGFLQPPESVADAVVFLCSSAGDYMTGATVLVDGGASLYPADDE